MRLAISAYVVPFIFAFHPALIMVETATEIILTTVTACLGVILLGAGCAGYLFRPLGWARRGMLWLAGLLLLLPKWSGVWLMVGAAGFFIGIVIVLWEWNMSSASEVPITQPNSGRS
jgi:TRAP-type uncharacterized transport system fused permease subunit